MYVYLYVYVYMCVWLNKCVFQYIIHTYTYIQYTYIQYTFIYIYICMCIHIILNIHIHMCACAFTFIDHRPFQPHQYLMRNTHRCQHRSYYMHCVWSLVRGRSWVVLANDWKLVEWNRWPTASIRKWNRWVAAAYIPILPVSYYIHISLS